MKPKIFPLQYSTDCSFFSEIKNLKKFKRFLLRELKIKKRSLDKSALVTGKWCGFLKLVNRITLPNNWISKVQSSIVKKASVEATDQLDRTYKLGKKISLLSELLYYQAYLHGLYYQEWD